MEKFTMEESPELLAFVAQQSDPDASLSRFEIVFKEYTVRGCDQKHCAVHVVSDNEHDSVILEAQYDVESWDSLKEDCPTLADFFKMYMASDTVWQPFRCNMVFYPGSVEGYEGLYDLTRIEDIAAYISN